MNWLRASIIAQVLDGLKLSGRHFAAKARFRVVRRILLHILVADEAMSPDPGDEVIRLVSPTR